MTCCARSSTNRSLTHVPNCSGATLCNTRAAGSAGVKDNAAWAVVVAVCVDACEQRLRLATALRDPPSGGLCRPPLPPDRALRAHRPVGNRIRGGCAVAVATGQLTTDCRGPPW